MIVATSLDDVIAVDGKIPWHYSGDLRFFKNMTMGHAVVMGRRTRDTLPKKCLPGREDFIVDRSIRDITLAFKSTLLAAKIWATKHEKDVWIVGGGHVYDMSMEYVEEVYITVVPKSFRRIEDERKVWFPHHRLTSQDFSYTNRIHPFIDHSEGVYIEVYTRK